MMMAGCLVRNDPADPSELFSGGIYEFNSPGLADTREEAAVVCDNPVTDRSGLQSSDKQPGCADKDSHVGMIDPVKIFSKIFK